MDQPSPPPRAASTAPRPGDGGRPLPAAELIEHLVVATHDLDRLQRLLDDAGQALSTHFQAAATQMKQLRRAVAARPDMDLRPLEVAMDHLSAAITSLQFRDLATQILEQAGGRLRDCAERAGGPGGPGDSRPDGTPATAASPETAFQDTVRLGFEPAPPPAAPAPAAGIAAGPGVVEAPAPVAA